MVWCYRCWPPDVWGNVILWGLKCEIERYAELSAMDANKDKSPTKTSEMVLSKKWDLKMRKELYQSVHGVQYDGGDL